jgi:putative phosphoribosyl transferase
MFTNRRDAGKQLAKKLAHYQDDNSLILAIPRGGVPVAYEVVKKINAELSLVIARKLPFPNNPEAGFGAIAEDGSTVFLNSAIVNLTMEMIQTIVNAQKADIQRRIKILRGGQPMPSINGRVTILVDDGIALGSTMRASIKMCTKSKPAKLVIASPVCSPELGRALKQMKAVDEVIILEQPRFFRAVAQVYEQWRDIPDHEVLEIMRQWKKEAQILRNIHRS